MINILDYEISLTWLGVALLVVGAVVIGLIGQFLGEVRTRWEWLPDAVAAFIGGFIGSEMLGTASTWGPEWEGVFLAPALIGALIVGFVVDLVVRMATGGSLTGHGRPVS
jgi:uncharacterized membrane protein YeaQ/YmgE (transglycosylase-associated protein family)